MNIGVDNSNNVRIYLVWSVGQLDEAPLASPIPLFIFQTQMKKIFLGHPNIANWGGIYRPLVLGLSFVRTSKTVDAWR